MAKLLRGTGPGKPIESIIIEAETPEETALLAEMLDTTWFGDGCQHPIDEIPNGDRLTIGLLVSEEQRREAPAPFTCPRCGTAHDRGWFGGVPGNYRCLKCGYTGPIAPLCDGCDVREGWEHRCHEDNIMVRGERMEGVSCACPGCHPTEEQLDAFRKTLEP